MIFVIKHVPEYPDEAEEYQIRFKRVERDKFGKWCFRYTRSWCIGGQEHESVCLRPIRDSDYKTIGDRKPIGQEAIDTAAEIVGRHLTSDEESYIMSVPVETR